MSEEPTVTDTPGPEHWAQRMLDNIWILLAVGIIVPAVLYLGWGLWELAELPTWGGR